MSSKIVRIKYLKDNIARIEAVIAGHHASIDLFNQEMQNPASNRKLLKKEITKIKQLILLQQKPLATYQAKLREAENPAVPAPAKTKSASKFEGEKYLPCGQCNGEGKMFYLYGKPNTRYECCKCKGAGKVKTDAYQQHLAEQKDPQKEKARQQNIAAKKARAERAKAGPVPTHSA